MYIAYNYFRQKQSFKIKYKKQNMQILWNVRDSKYPRNSLSTAEYRVPRKGCTPLRGTLYSSSFNSHKSSLKLVKYDDASRVYPELWRLIAILTDVCASVWPRCQCAVPTVDLWSDRAARNSWGSDYWVSKIRTLMRTSFCPRLRTRFSNKKLMFYSNLFQPLPFSTYLGT